MLELPRMFYFCLLAQLRKIVPLAGSEKKTRRTQKDKEGKRNPLTAKPFHPRPPFKADEGEREKKHTQDGPAGRRGRGAR